MVVVVVVVVAAVVLLLTYSVFPSLTQDLTIVTSGVCIGSSGCRTLYTVSTGEVGVTELFSWRL